MGGTPRLRGDIIDRLMDIRQRVSHLETRGVDWYRAPGGGVSTPWADVPIAAGWDQGTSNQPGAAGRLKWRILADRVCFTGFVTCAVSGASPVAVVLSDARPLDEQVVYWRQVLPNGRVVGSLTPDGVLTCPGAVAGRVYLIGDVSFPAAELP